MEFKYIANDRKTGKPITALASAESVGALVLQLKNQGLIPLKITEKRSKIFKLSFGFNRVSPKDLVIFTRQLSATLNSGLLLTEALEIISEDMENEDFRRIVTHVRESIHKGDDFSTALSRHHKIFSNSYVSIIQTGEETGKLASTVTSLAKYLEHIQHTKEKVKSAIRYPLFVISFACLTVFVIVVFLIPKFKGMFDQFGATLPLMTRIVFGISEIAIKYTPLFLVLMAASLVAAIYCLRFYPFLRFVDGLKIKLPIIGKEVIHKAMVSRFCRTFGFLLAGGINLSTSLDITAKVVNHTHMAEAIETMKRNIMAGAVISEEMRNQKIFPRLVSKMTHVGERTGKLSEMFDRTADYYDEELESTLNNLTAMLEPSLIIFIGCIILIVVLALYLPIFQMSAVMR